MTKKDYSKYEAKEEFGTLSFNYVLLHKKDTKMYQVIFLSLLNWYQYSLFLHWIYQFIVAKITAPKFMDPRSKYDLFSGCNLSDKEKDERSMAGYQLEIVNQGFLQLMSPLEKVRALSN